MIQDVIVKQNYYKYSNSDEKIPFETIYSDDQVVLKTIFERINKVWNVKTGRGAMNNVQRVNDLYRLNVSYYLLTYIYMDLAFMCTYVQLKANFVVLTLNT